MDSSASHRPVAETLLELDGIETYYGPLRALSGVSLTVAQGSVTAILGSNGAGKSTLLVHPLDKLEFRDLHRLMRRNANLLAGFTYRAIERCLTGVQLTAWRVDLSGAVSTFLANQQHSVAFDKKQ